MIDSLYARKKAANELIEMMERNNVSIDVSAMLRLQAGDKQWIVTNVDTGEYTKCNRIDVIAICKRITQSGD